MKLAGILRQTDYSPNHIENDSLILLQTRDNLQRMGAEVTIFREEQIGGVKIEADLIFSMVQGCESTQKMLELEMNGAMIINSPRAVMNCYRTNMIEVMQKNNIPFPNSIPIDLSAPNDVVFEQFDCRKIWVKRGDVHAVHREDVTLIYSEEERKNILREFAHRGIKFAVLQEHLDGDVIKFYAVKGSGLFEWYYLNGINHTPFVARDLEKLAGLAADALGLDVYGGDAVISRTGEITIIDMNDWPSFAPVRTKASQKIAELIFQRAKHYVY